MRSGRHALPGPGLRRGVGQLLARRVARNRGAGAQHGEGYDAAFTADGPRGPRYVAKPGPVLLARRTGCPIICVHAYCRAPVRSRRLGTCFKFPIRFRASRLLFSPPIEVPQGADRGTINRKHAEMQSLLERVRDVAESWFTLPPAERERQRAIWNALTVHGRARTPTERFCADEFRKRFGERQCTERPGA